MRTIVFISSLCLLALPAAAQEGGGSGQGGQGGQGGGTNPGTGDAFGDLYEILRDQTTGVPILLRKDVLLPGDVPGWAYCPVPIDVNGNPLPLTTGAEEGCDVDPAYASLIVEVDYFGRLNGARAGERNMRMHFDEFINRIRDAEVVDRDAAGRLYIGTDCTPEGCASWHSIDSPMENMALYWRVMKWGHIQTDPAEPDTSPGGDPALGTVYHPALRAEDWAKIRDPRIRGLLPRGAPADCFGPGYAGGFNPDCAAQRLLTAPLFVRAASFLGGAADKNGKTTVDLVHYFNRIIKIPVATTDSPAALATLPALYRIDGDPTGTIYEGDATMPFPANERFVDYSAAQYLRATEFDRTVPALVRGSAPGTWVENPAVDFTPYLVYSNGEQASMSSGTAAFVLNAADAQRAVQFVHEYEIPVDLMPVEPPPPVQVSVPPVVGLTQAAAEAAILAATLQVGTIASQHDPSDAGTVLAQDPAASTLVDPGTAVNLTVSLGPAPVTAVVPNLAGMSTTDAGAALTALGLVLGPTTSQYNAAPAGTIIGQDPAFNTTVPLGTAVSIVVSLGPAPTSCTLAPGAPTGLTATVVGNSVTLSWTAPAGDPWNAPTFYRIEAGTTPGSAAVVQLTSGPVTTFTGFATPGTFYARVRAQSPCGTSGASNEVTVVVR